MTRRADALSEWLLPYAGEHGYRDVTCERWRFGPWLAYWTWRALRRSPLFVRQPRRPA